MRYNIAQNYNQLCQQKEVPYVYFISSVLYPFYVRMICFYVDFNRMVLLCKYTEGWCEFGYIL